MCKSLYNNIEDQHLDDQRKRERKRVCMPYSSQLDPGLSKICQHFHDFLQREITMERVVRGWYDFKGRSEIVLSRVDSTEETQRLGEKY